MSDSAYLGSVATLIRQDIISMLEVAGSGHSAGALGLADIFAYLYFQELKHDPKNPFWEERDRLVLSAGHTNPVLYAALAEAGYFPRSELLTLRKFGSRLQGHPHNLELPGVETSSGPLGQGLSQAIGMALSFKMDVKPNRVYAVLSDGEHQEGQTWEAILFAGGKNLDNLCVIVDRNGIQIDGPTENVVPLGDLARKYFAFGWDVVEVDGHDFEHLESAFDRARTTTGRPTCIVAHTTPGKGVSFMENDFHWHGKPPTSEEADKALKELCSHV
jgi:transketolase